MTRQSPSEQISESKTAVHDSAPPVLYEKCGRVARVTLNRPKVLNAMNSQMHQELAKVWDDFEGDSNLWIAVLTGAGDSAFSVGQDLKELAERCKRGERPTTFGSLGAPGSPRLTERFTISKPIIARVNGYALGGGLELALASDIIIAAEHATFALPEAKLGLIPGAGGLFRLMQQLPPRVAMGYMMTGRKFGAHIAQQFGLVNEVVPMDALDATVERWIEDILACAPLSIRVLKEVAMLTGHLSIRDAFQHAARSRVELSRRNSDDCVEGVLAFLESRAPLWKGH